VIHRFEVAHDSGRFNGLCSAMSSKPSLIAEEAVVSSLMLALGAAAVWPRQLWLCCYNDGFLRHGLTPSCVFPTCLCCTAAANQHFNLMGNPAAAAAAAAANNHGLGNPGHHSAPGQAAARSGGAAGSSGGVGAVAGNSTRSKSRRTAPSVNSGGTGPPLGTKRGLEATAEADTQPAKKVGARGRHTCYCCICLHRKSCERVELCVGQLLHDGTCRRAWLRPCSQPSTPLGGFGFAL